MDWVKGVEGALLANMKEAEQAKDWKKIIALNNFMESSKVCGHQTRHTAMLLPPPLPSCYHNDHHIATTSATMPGQGQWMGWTLHPSGVEAVGSLPGGDPGYA